MLGNGLGINLVIFMPIVPVLLWVDASVTDLCHSEDELLKKTGGLCRLVYGLHQAYGRVQLWPNSTVY